MGIIQITQEAIVAVQIIMALRSLSLSEKKINNQKWLRNRSIQATVIKDVQEDFLVMFLHIKAIDRPTVLRPIQCTEWVVLQIIFHYPQM